VSELINMTFLDLLKARKIRIPQIQRDYAEGRRNPKIRDIRRAFLNDLLDSVYSNGVRLLHLDFIYGYDRNDAFEPLDGQQRLTTLFIFHWIFSPAENKDLIGSDGLSRFTYETRISAEEFCNEIVKHAAYVLHDESDAKSLSVSEVIRTKDWFKWAWRKDATVISMLVVIDEVFELMKESGYTYDTSRYAALSCISFHWLDLDKFSQGDELYVKMNARGLQLSAFDILKSTLEEELRQQNAKSYAGEEAAAFEEEWKRIVDNDWIDYFWSKRGIRENDEVDVAEVENRYMRLLLRLVSIQFARQDVCPQLAEVANSRDERTLESLIPRYTAEVWRSRHSMAAKCPYIDFQQLYKDMQSLIGFTTIGQNRQWFDLTQYLDLEYGWDSTGSKSILDLYLQDTFSYPVRLGFYGILAFLRKFPLRTMVADDNDGGKKGSLEDLKTWGRFLRNCTIIENCNDRFDDVGKVISAMAQIDLLIEEFAKSGMRMDEFLGAIENVPGFERARIEEESAKAKLRVADPEWENLMREAETDAYLRGQIRCLLGWSRIDGICNKTEFKAYAKCLRGITTLFSDGVEESKRCKFYAAMLTISDYRFGKHKSFGIVSPAERFYSWKRYLRDDIDGCCAPGIKAFIDFWRSEKQDETDVIAVCDAVIMQRKSTVCDWRRFLISMPRLFARDYAYWGVVSNNSEHWFLSRGKTENSRGFELLLAYVYESVPNDGRRFHDSIRPEPETNSIEFTKDGHVYRLKATCAGSYSLFTDENEEAGLTDEDVLSKLGISL
jgi:hypothetical protein